jgi:hypothetical protein
MRFAQILSLAVVASALTTQRRCRPCYEPEPVCGCQSTTGGLPATNFKIACPDTGFRGVTGTLSSKSKAQALNAAKANNKFEELVERLDWNEKNKESEKGQQQSNSVLTSKSFIKIEGCYKATQDIKKKSAAKEAESGKAANCFRREQKSHLCIIRPPVYEPLDQRELVDCDCSCKPLSTSRDNCLCYN